MTAANDDRRPPRAALAAWVIIALVFAVTALDLIVRGTSISPDSVSYMSMAEGLRDLAAVHWSGAPTGLWPYGYPAVLALAGGRVQMMIEWGPAVHLSLLVGTAAYLVLIAQRLAGRRPSSAYLIAAAAFLASPAVLVAAQWLLSDLLFTFVALAVIYHVVIQSLLSNELPRRLDLFAGAIATFVLPNVRYIGLSVPLGLAAGVVILRLLRDPDHRVLARRAALPIACGVTGFSVALLFNMTTADTLVGTRLPPAHFLSSAILNPVATFWQVLVGPDRFPLRRYEVAAGLFVAITLIVLALRTARVAWGHGDYAYRRFTVWTLTSIATYLIVLLWAALTTDLDPISPRFVLPILPVAVMWLVDSYVVASGANPPGNTLRLDRLAGLLVIALWLGSFLWSAGFDLAQQSRSGDLAAIDFGNQDRDCLARIENAPLSARISNNAALIWLGTDERATAKQASFEEESPTSFYFIDMGSNAVGTVHAALLSGTTSSFLCRGEHLAVERLTRPRADQH